MFFDPKPFDLYNTNIRQRHGRNEPLIIDLVMEMTFKFSLGKVDRISFPSYLKLSGDISKMLQDLPEILKTLMILY